LRIEFQGHIIMRDKMITRLQLGASRLESLDPSVLPKILDKTWMHFGDSRVLQSNPVPDFRKLFSKDDLVRKITRIIFRIMRIGQTAATADVDISELYSKTNFQDFYYRKGDRLPFDDNSMSFIFSEHFFEHLFLDEAVSLFMECHRILQPCGVIRTCVPDADLRTYESPEPLGFPDIRLPFTDPSKHKTRWSVYSLAEALRIAGFDAIPLRYCDNKGEFVKVDPSSIVCRYENCPERDLMFDLTYIWRLNNSLIVDGIK
jgi:predicted SAM-dependent methyltransferase